MSARLQTAVVGATGYTGFELVRLLARHPRLSPPLLFRREDESGALDLADVFPHVSGNGSRTIEPFSWQALHQGGVNLLFMATPHELSREWIPEAIARGIRVVDLSGAWRLKDAANRAVYGFKNGHANHALDNSAVYGLPELHAQQVAQAQLVANPGCYATSVILGLAPLALAAKLEGGVICDCKSGVSGAGKAPTAKTHFVEVTENLSAYSVFGHRHTGEILEQLGLKAEQVVFTPHLLPIARGILSTLYVTLKERTTADELASVYREFYTGAPFVRVFAPPRLPQIQYCTRTNYCDIGMAVAPDGRRAVIVSCLDNLLKGAAGQAVQNMNVMYGWPQEEGLQ